MTMHKPLHPTDDAERLYVQEKQEEEYLPAFKTV